jgi:hypothetical protein
MLEEENVNLFIKSLEQSLTKQQFVKLSLGNYYGNEVDLKNIYIKKVLIKEREMLSFTYRYKTRDIVKNHLVSESIVLIKNYIQSAFKIATLFDTTGDIQLEFLSNNKWILRNLKSSQVTVPNAKHDREKKRLVVTGPKSYLYHLGITNAEGVVLKHAQDKYKQINHYIELLRVLLEALPKQDLFEVVDMGAGKGYLTFALYDYLVNSLHVNARIKGIEFREDLVNLCNKVADQQHFSNLHFKQGSIADYKADKVNMLIALHACDTATDDAIFKGIKAEAELIVAAPCCHKQIRNEIEKGKKPHELDFMLKHGIYLERQAEMVTDGLRALILGYHGYKTKVFEFISESHTPKNIMIVAQKLKVFNKADKQDIAEKILNAKAFFGIQTHYLEELFDQDVTN